MQYNIEFTLPTNQTNFLLNDDDRTSTWRDMLEDKREVESLLAEYHSGAPLNYSVDCVEMEEDGRGWFSVNYTVEIYSGCTDVNKDEDYMMDISFSIDWLTGEVCLTGEDIPEREPDTY